MLRLILLYFVWHYTQAFKDLYHLFRNFASFFYHFFSIKVLSKTLFSPWRKLNESYKKGFDLSRMFETFVVNVIMRAVGFFLRLFIILAGLFVIACTIVAGVIVFVLWILLPFIITLLFISGIRLLM